MSTLRLLRRHPWLLRALYPVLGVAGVGLALVLLTFIFGRVAGEEFSPHTFERRTFSFFEIPVVGLQVTPIKRDDVTSDLEKKLVADKIVAAAPPKSPRWDLVYGYQGGKNEESDPALLTSYFDTVGADGESVWLDWTSEHPKLARVFWPAVKEVARREHYLLAPELFQAARGASDPQELRDALHKTLLDRYQLLAAAKQQLGDHEQAVDLLSGALYFDPDNQEILRRRADSLQALGKEEEAAKDLEKAEDSK